MVLTKQVSQLVSLYLVLRRARNEFFGQGDVDEEFAGVSSQRQVELHW